MISIILQTWSCNFPSERSNKRITDFCSFSQNNTMKVMIFLVMLLMRNSGFSKVVFLILFSFSFDQSSAEISLCSWNLKDFGKTKNAAEIEFIATTINE